MTVDVRDVVSSATLSCSKADTNVLALDTSTSLLRICTYARLRREMMQKTQVQEVGRADAWKKSQKNKVVQRFWVGLVDCVAWPSPPSALDIFSRNLPIEPC